MGLTSTAQPGRRASDVLDYELGMPMHGITVKTEMEYRIEAARREELAAPPPVVMKPHGYGKPTGWIDTEVSPDGVDRRSF